MLLEVTPNLFNRIIHFMTHNIRCFPYFKTCFLTYTRRCFSGVQHRKCRHLHTSLFTGWLTSLLTLLSFPYIFPLHATSFLYFWFVFLSISLPLKLSYKVSANRFQIRSTILWSLGVAQYSDRGSAAKYFKAYQTSTCCIFRTNNFQRHATHLRLCSLFIFEHCLWILFYCKARALVLLKYIT